MQCETKFSFTSRLPEIMEWIASITLLLILDAAITRSVKHDPYLQPRPTRVATINSNCNGVDYQNSVIHTSDGFSSLACSRGFGVNCNDFT